MPRAVTLLSFVVLGASCNATLEPDRLQEPPGAARYASSLRAPARLTSIPAGENAKDLRVACATCHSLRATQPVPAGVGQLEAFHVGLVFSHGDLACASCHLAGPTPRLHLATGEAIVLADAVRLCAQCHGPQWRDFQHGAHGGMTGHWDLSRGPRERNHCVDCHDPHAPRFVGGQPVLPPRDRFLSEGPH